jgi:hypothetical protein
VTLGHQNQRSRHPVDPVIAKRLERAGRVKAAQR